MGNITPTLNCLKGDDIDDIKSDIKMIKENHLKHIEKDVADIKTDIKLILLRLPPPHI